MSDVLDNKPFIEIRHAVTESGKRGYRWTCLLCDATGMHRFKRWTDWVRRQRPDPHPMQRCITAAERHTVFAHPHLVRIWSKL